MGDIATVGGMKFTQLPHTWDDVIAEVERGGHTYVEDLHEADFLIYSGGPGGLPELPDNIGFVQYVFAGVEALIDDGTLHADVRWANAGGVYGKPVAEIAMSLLLAAYHQHKVVSSAGSFEVQRQVARAQDWLFHNKTVALIGAGGIGKELIHMLKPFGVRIIAVNRSGSAVEGTDAVHTLDEMDSVWEEADVFILSTPLTEETHQLIGAAELERMKPTAVLVNVGRGKLVDTQALVDALKSGSLAAAAMDVTDPEPLPEDHPLWSMHNVIITPHIAAPPRVARMMIAPHIVENADAFARGETMPSEVDFHAGY